MSETPHEAIVAKFDDAIIHGDMATIDSVLADNFMDYGPARKDSMNKADNLAEWKRAFDSLYSSIGLERIAMLSDHADSGRVAGDWVMEWGTITLNYKTGKTPVAFNYNSVYKMNNGKIEAEHDFFDVADIMRQQGFTFTPDPATKPKK